jgi:hypothetical protein
MYSTKSGNLVRREVLALPAHVIHHGYLMDFTGRTRQDLDKYTSKVDCAVAANLESAADSPEEHADRNHFGQAGCRRSSLAMAMTEICEALAHPIPSTINHLISYPLALSGAG